MGGPVNPDGTVDVDRASTVSRSQGAGIPPFTFSVSPMT